MIEPCGTPGVICMALDKVFFSPTPLRFIRKKSHTSYLIASKCSNKKVSVYFRWFALNPIPFNIIKNMGVSTRSNALAKSEKIYKLNIVSFELFLVVLLINNFQESHSNIPIYH